MTQLNKNWFATYLKFIENSCESRMFQNFICHDERGVFTDVLEGGTLSCAVFVSGILKMFDKISSVHGTVEATEKDMLFHRWVEIETLGPENRDLKAGDVLIWEPEKEGHLHMGFYMGNDQAISNSSEKKVPVKHHFTFDGTRKILKMYRVPWGKHLVESTPATPEVWTAVDTYLNDLVVQADTRLQETLQNSDKHGLPYHHVSATQGNFLQILAQLVGAKKILEIGTLAGYSAIWMASVLPKDGKLITLEYDWEDVDIARENIANANLSDVIEVRLGRALELLPKIAEENVVPFDMIFIDADKQHNPEYLEWALKLSRPGTLIVADNVVRNGTILHADSQDPSVQGIRKFFDLIAKEPRINMTVLQTVGDKGYDGLGIGVVKS